MFSLPISQDIYIYIHNLHQIMIIITTCLLLIILNSNVDYYYVVHNYLPDCMEMHKLSIQRTQDQSWIF